MSARLQCTQATTAMDPQSGHGSGAVPGNRDFDRARRLPSDPPRRRRALMAQQRTGSTAKDGGHPATLAAQVWPADRVDAAKDRVQAASRDPVADRLRCEPLLDELCSRYEAILPASERPNAATGSLTRFGGHSPTKSTASGASPHAAEPARASRACRYRSRGARACQRRSCAPPPSPRRRSAACGRPPPRAAAT
jgi:hypothetical protein